jgi:hypothetical protein
VSSALREETERLEREANPARFLMAHGYTLQRGESSPSCLVLDGPGRFVVTRSEEGRYRYDPLDTARGGGSLARLVRQVLGPVGTGRVLMTLRDCAGTAWRKGAREALDIRLISEEQRKLYVRWHSLATISSRNRLLQTGFDRGALRGRGIREDRRGNAYFPARDQDGDLTGLYKYGRGPGGYDTAGAPGIYVDEVGQAEGIVISDDPVLGLGFEMRRGKRYRQMAIFWQRSAALRQLLQRAVGRQGPAWVWVVTGHDRVGDAAARWITESILALGPYYPVRRAQALGGTWNEDLSAGQSATWPVGKAPGVR